MRSVRGDSARTVLVHPCELLPRPKVSPHSLILRGNNSAAQLSLRLRENNPYDLAREEHLSRDIFSRQAAKVAKEKHKYSCNDFSRLMLAVAR